ncbi:dihydrodipicolinate synthase family protein [Aspergillus homomorphus CBS 101889]|uniref:Dihydrodipicolinate synthase n=1 Tax=Aspergillus homomorphus (strain CBS 101889) TaxID=1450537 RepID=A0A395HXL9_ASPHC|nr:dihydrodipicolinate synthase [Aspergillus homomorphus CBS 101889]RAL12672.1 dihydrodipicolinate synthase [Aspergillus homomorphus CBS 101889]
MTVNGSFSSTPTLHGIMVALITPFNDDRTQIDGPRLKAHMDHLIAAGVHGLVPGGSTGEFTTLSRAERKQLTELCVEYAAGRVPVVAGTGSTSTDEAVELAVHAAQAGAAAVMVVPPFYDALTYEQLTELMAEIHSSSGLPIVYYNIPSASGLTLTATQIADLSAVGVKYLKDTSGNAPAYTELVFGLSDKITAFNGWDTLTFYGLAAGSEGAVWGAANLIPELSVELWNAVAVEKNLDKGRALWRKAWPICKFLESHNYAAAVKTGVELMGQSTGGLRKPFALLKGEVREELARLMENAGVKVVR